MPHARCDFESLWHKLVCNMQKWIIQEKCPALYLKSKDVASIRASGDHNARITDHF